MKLSEDLLTQLWPHAAHSLIGGAAATSEAVFEKFGLNTMDEIADFVAQGSEETGGCTAIEENLNYSPTRLMQVWPSRFPSLSAAAPYAHNPRGLADNVYGGRYGNRPGTEDGYDFRGRGFLQQTFRAGYERIAQATGLDLVGHPDLINDPQNFLACGAAFWKLTGLNAYADSHDIRGETLRLNGGYTNLQTRLAWRATVRRALGMTP